MLSRREEIEFIRRAQRGDHGARDRLWVAFHEYAVAEATLLVSITELVDTFPRHAPIEN